MFFIEADIFHRMGSLLVLYSMILTFSFKVRFSCYAFALKKMQSWMSSTDVSQLAQPLHGLALV